MESGLTDALIAVLAVVAFPFVFAGAWSLALFANATIGGWSRLARSYRVDGERPGHAALVSGSFRHFVSYRGVLYVAGTPEGLHLSVLRLFRPAHPNLLVPWEQVLHTGEAPSLLQRRVSLHVDGIPIAIPAEAWEAAEAARG